LKTRVYVFFFILGLLEVWIAAVFLPVPGYMDAEYYYAGGLQLANGQGFTEPYLWNYLDNPVGLPHPSHTYWMPLASVIAAGGMLLTGELDFFSARLLFFLLAACIAPLTVYLCWRITGDRFQSGLAGAFALVPGFYAVYLGETDSFATSMILGTLFLLLGTGTGGRRWARWLGLGLTAGWLNLARVDGIVWFGAGLFLAGWQEIKQSQALHGNWKVVWKPLFWVTAGYLVIMFPWYIRTLALFGQPFSPAGSRVLWLTNYDAMFSYPASNITLELFFSQGLANFLKTLSDALISNLGTVLAVQGQVFILVLCLIGFWRMRQKAVIRLGAGLWLVTFGLMTLVFPLAGARGGYLHASAAFQPLIWASAPAGFIRLIEIGVLKRNWKLDRARIGFGLILVFLAALMTAGIFYGLVFGPESGKIAWEKSSKTYAAVDQALDRLGIPRGEIVMINNPPGFYLSSGRPAIVIPYPGLDALRQAARQFGSTTLVLEKDTVIGMQALYNKPGSFPGLELLETIENAQIYRIHE
jgi:hypothetical protein